MNALLQILAWAAGIISLFLVGDMIVADLAYRRAERIAARQIEAELPAQRAARLRR
jgi:uncharacterized membrane protein